VGFGCQGARVGVGGKKKLVKNRIQGEDGIRNDKRGGTSISQNREGGKKNYVAPSRKTWLNKSKVRGEGKKQLNQSNSEPGSRKLKKRIPCCRDPRQKGNVPKKTARASSKEGSGGTEAEEKRKGAVKFCYMRAIVSNQGGKERVR